VCNFVSPLSEGNGLMIFESRILRKILWPKREKVMALEKIA
jgi:hypothetical protein